MQELKKNILKTLVWFDLFDYPLTASEIWRYLLNTDFKELSTDIRKQESEIKIILDKLIREVKIGQKDEFYFLKNRQEIVGIRKQRQKISLKKLKKPKD